MSFDTKIMILSFIVDKTTKYFNFIFYSRQKSKLASARKSSFFPILANSSNICKNWKEKSYICRPKYNINK